MSGPRSLIEAGAARDLVASIRIGAGNGRTPMRLHVKASIFGAVCGAFILMGAASQAAALSGVADLNEVSALPMIQQVHHTTPAGAQCIKWTRRWNTRHGVGHRRCVQWR
jgi:hypothetical protein